MRASEIECPICSQKIDEPCIGPDRLPLRYYHDERISAALILPSLSRPVQASSDEWDRVLGRVVDEQL